MEIVTIVTTFIQLMLENSPIALNVILFLIIAFLIWERRLHTKLLLDQSKKIEEIRIRNDQDLHDVVDKYYNENLEMIKALDEIKLVLSIISYRHS